MLNEKITNNLCQLELLSSSGKVNQEWFYPEKSIPLSYEVNYKLLPVIICPITDNGMAEFNAYLDYVYSHNFNKLTRTSSGGISLNKSHFLPPMYDVRDLRSCVELTVIGKRMFRLQFRSDVELAKGVGISGAKAFETFKSVCNSFHLDLEKFAIGNGYDVKQTIPAPKIHLNREFENLLIKNAYHIDIHSAFLAGIAESVPELRPPIEYIYNNRKTGRNLYYKAVLTHSFGFFQSKMCGYRFSHLSKYAIENTNSKLEMLAKRIEKNGGLVIAFNTDGIWYYGKEYHGPGEGKELGMWENDHKVERIIFKGIGTYGYTENGVFTPVVRGLRGLDRVKPRSEWCETDLNNLGETIQYGWTGEKIVKLGDKNAE